MSLRLPAARADGSSPRHGKPVCTLAANECDADIAGKTRRPPSILYKDQDVDGHDECDSDDGADVTNDAPDVGLLAPVKSHDRSFFRSCARALIVRPM